MRNRLRMTMALAAAIIMTTSVTAFAGYAKEESPKGPLTSDQALEVALEHSGYTKDEVDVIKLEKDIDDGVEKYEVDFYVGVNKYEYDIDINTGKILEYEIDD
ncbi:PepSY domain-containing protein [Butyrivibrio sp. FC2001]|uniref:PepSY domain-containing protein n=1 Tax=Butyrivibrio sp. FC2001 TaxID=1280671 RepID=UPI0009DBA7CA|nr:PepSY domain-containing protein [Butyrivibrio sp. FC2001]